MLKSALTATTMQELQNAITQTIKLKNPLKKINLGINFEEKTYAWAAKNVKIDKIH